MAPDYISVGKNKSQKGEISIRITLRRFLPNILSEDRFFCIDLGCEVLSTVRNLQKPKALVPQGLMPLLQTCMSGFLQDLDFSCPPWMVAILRTRFIPLQN